MMYEPRKKRRRRHPMRRFFIKTLLGILLTAAILTGAVLGILYVLPVSTFLLDPAEELCINSDLPVSRMNILLLGVDYLAEGHQRSDSMMLLSVADDDVALVSLMRDMMVEIPGRALKQKLNSAYAHGGEALTLQTVNRSFHMNAAKYVCVDFMGFLHLVDALGGVELSITEAEKDALNSILTNNRETLQRYGFFPQMVEAAGANVRLDGVQALGFARIRKLDSDYNRTGRQRQLIEAIWRKIKKAGFTPATVKALWQVYRQDVRTNLSLPEIVSIGLKVLRAGGITTHRLPAEGTFEDTGSELKIDAAANADVLRDWLYGN